MDIEAVQERKFRGIPYKISCTEREGYQHPSWFSFDDESAVRERDWKIQPGDIVLDVGAAYGSYTLTALAAGAERVYAWSPQGPPGEESEADVMRKSLALNDWDERVRIYRLGVYDRTGWLNCATQEFSEGPIEPRTNDVIPVTTLDDWYGFVQPGPVDWMKLDVEGAEVEVLRGARTLIMTCKPTILVENHLFKRATIGDEVRGVLAEMGYQHISTHPYHAISHSVFWPVGDDRS